MKKILAIAWCFLFVFLLGSPALAVEEGASDKVVWSNQESLDNGITMIREIVVSGVETRSTSKTYTDKRTYVKDDVTIAEIWVTATFQYDGSTVSVTSKSISKCETYDGWSFKQSSFTSTGGTVTLTGKLTKLIVLKADVSISLTCDKNGNVS